MLTGVKGYAGGREDDASIGHSGSELKESAQNFVNRYEFEKVLADGSYDFVNQANNTEAARNRLRLRLSTLRPAESTLTTVDLSATRELAQLAASWDSSTAFFDDTQGDPRGRIASVKVNYRF